jgi:aerobic C4-dicarboxylate transport protein
VTAALFVFVVLGLIARFVGFSIFKFIAYIKDELLIVLGTSSSESALPQLMEKLERLGCSKPVVGLVVPTGYSFNLDGTNIYMTLATLFIAQALGVELSFSQRALTNITGNGIATVFVSWWEGELDRDKLHANLNKTIDPSDVETAVTTG